MKVHDIRTGIPFKPLHYAVALGRSNGSCADIEPDLLHTHFLTGYGYWGAFSGFHPIIMTVWGDDVYLTPHQSFLKGWLARTVLTPRRPRHGRLEGHPGPRRGRWAPTPDVCHVVQWGVDLTSFRPDAPTDVREKLGIPEDAPVVSQHQELHSAVLQHRRHRAGRSRRYTRRGRTRTTSSRATRATTRSSGRSRASSGSTSARTSSDVSLTRNFPATWSTSDVFLSVPSVDATAGVAARGHGVRERRRRVGSRFGARMGRRTAERRASCRPRTESSEDAILSLIASSPELREQLGAAGVAPDDQGASRPPRAHGPDGEALVSELVRAGWKRTADEERPIARGEVRSRTVSIVMPTFRKKEPPGVDAERRSAAQTYPHELDGGRRRRRLLGRRHVGRLLSGLDDRRSRWFPSGTRSTRGGPPRGTRRSTRATGDLVSSSTTTCVPSRDLIERTSASTRRIPEPVVIGNALTAPELGPRTCFATSTQMGVHKHRPAPVVPARYFVTNNASVERRRAARRRSVRRDLQELRIRGHRAGVPTGGRRGALRFRYCAERRRLPHPRPVARPTSWRSDTRAREARSDTSRDSIPTGRANSRSTF